MSPSVRRKLKAIDDPISAEVPLASQPTREPKRTAALYVELPMEQWDALARAAFELRTHKRIIVASLIADCVDATSDEGRRVLRDLLARHRKKWS
jgi:hypothetical protein